MTTIDFIEFIVVLIALCWIIPVIVVAVTDWKRLEREETEDRD